MIHKVKMVLVEIMNVWRLYYWIGLGKDVDNHVKQCIKCRQQNLYPQCFALLHLEDPPMPMYFIVMDLIDNFKPLSQWHQYALTVINMLKAGSTSCFHLENETII